MLVSRRLIIRALTLTANPVTFRSLVVVAGLLTVPAECGRIGYPHSLLVTSAAATPDSGPAIPHAASDHDAATSQAVPFWATPLGVDADVTVQAHSVGVQAHSVHSGIGIQRGTPLVGAATSSDLPVVEPAISTATAAFGSPIAAVISLIVALMTGSDRIGTALMRRIALMIPAMDPPPLRGCVRSA